MLRINNGNYVFFEKKLIRLVYSPDMSCWKAITNDTTYIKYGFFKDDSFFVKIFEINKIYDIIACKISTYCRYKSGLYYFENIWNGFAILLPELETKIQLGLHAYDDRRIEINYDEFINEVEEIWEERTPIEGFKFDVETIHFIKRKEK